VSADLARLAAARERCAPFADLFPFEPHFQAVESGSLHYLDEGPRDAPVLLALHGNPTWSFYFRELVREFSRDHRVIVPDHMGMGLSDRPRGWSYDLAGHVANLERLADELELEEVTLALHDWGGAIGAGLAVKRPERVTRLVVLNTAAFIGRMPWRIALSRTPGLGRIAVQGGNAFLRAALTQAVERPLPAAVRRAYLAPYARASEREAIWRFVRDIPASPGHPSFGLIESISTGLRTLADRPTCILWGERDGCYTPHYRRAWQERFPAAVVHRFVAAGHWVLEDAGTELLARLREWLQRTPSRRRELTR
jgi:haloalkane dehalogenase